METNTFIKEMKEINSKILKYLEQEDNCDSEFQVLVNIIKDFKIEQNKYKLGELIHVLSQIYEYHFNNLTTRTKVEQIILFLKDSLQRTFSSEELYYLALKRHHIINLFYKNKMINISREISIDMINSDMLNELIKFLQNENSKENLINNENNEKIDKSELNISQIIEQDLIDEFISFTEKNKMDLSAQLENVEYAFLKVNPIEYASFYDSIKIINYLLSKDVELTPLLWENAINLNHLELVKKLHDKKIECPTLNYDESVLLIDDIEEGTYDALFNRAIQSHNNEIAKYLQENFLNEINIEEKFLSYIFKYHNYEFIPDDLSTIDKQKLLTYACDFGYPFIIDQFLNEIDLEMCQDLLFLAIKDKNIDIVRILLNKPGIDVNYCKIEIDNCGKHYENERTPLCRAVNSGVCEIVKLLLSNPKIDINKSILIFNFNENDYSILVLITINLMEF